MFTTLIVVLIVLCAFAILYWGVNQIAIPQPVKVVVLVIIGLVMLAVIYNFVIGGGSVDSLRLR